MSLALGPLGYSPVAGRAPHAAPPPAPGPAPAVAAAEDRVDLSRDAKPAAPAPHVALSSAAEMLAAQSRELHIWRDEACGRIIVQVCDREGSVLRTIPASEAELPPSGRRR